MFCSFAWRTILTFSRCLVPSCFVQQGKEWYEKRGLRETSAEIAKQQVEYALKLTRAGYEVLCILGLEFSPACAPNYLNKGRRIVKGKGIYMEELERELEREELRVRFIGVNQRWTKKLRKELRECVHQKEAALAQVDEGSGRVKGGL